MRSRPFDESRDGFLMGEGAGMLVLEVSGNRRRHAAPLSFVSSWAMAPRMMPITSLHPPRTGQARPSPCNWRLTMQISMRKTLAISTHTARRTHLNDKSETAAIKKVFGPQAYHVPISSTKSMTGHLLGASGSLEAVFCARVFKEDILPATINYELPTLNATWTMFQTSRGPHTRSTLCRIRSVSAVTTQH